VAQVHTLVPSRNQYQWGSTLLKEFTSSLHLNFNCVPVVKTETERGRDRVRAQEGGAEIRGEEAEMGEAEFFWMTNLTVNRVTR
jgi:hypothetical protein